MHLLARSSGVLAWVVMSLSWPSLADDGVQSLTKVTVTADQCAKLVGHRARADVTYTPGVDARGKPVVPAQAREGVALPSAQELIIPLEIDLAERLGIVFPSGVTPTAKLGEITIRNGAVRLNGQKIKPDDQAALTDACNASRSATD